MDHHSTQHDSFTIHLLLCMSAATQQPAVASSAAGRTPVQRLGCTTGAPLWRLFIQYKRPSMGLPDTARLRLVQEAPAAEVSDVCQGAAQGPLLQQSTDRCCITVCPCNTYVHAVTAWHELLR